jgi:hypothetical protein
VTIKPSIQNFLWMATGAVMLLVVMLVVLHFQTGQSPAEQLAFKAKRVDLVARMRLTRYLRMGPRPILVTWELGNRELANSFRGAD